MTQHRLAVWLYRLLILVLVFFLGYITGTLSLPEVQVTIRAEEPRQTAEQTQAPAEEPEEAPAPAEEIQYPLNLNEATAEQLDTLPGIGPELAQRIVAYRETCGAFLDPIQIMDVEGIGEGKYEKLAELITVEADQ